MAWPQHYVFIGPEKKRPTYDQLEPIQWMAGCLQGALDLPDAEKQKNLQYLSDLLQDAADFSFDRAKACHAMVLTAMEFDKVTLHDTMELDRLRRQHAQRHVSSKKANNSHKGKVGQHSDKSDVPCKYFNDGHCSKSDTHLTKGVWYLHICSKCKSSEHSAKKCRPKNV